MRETFRKFANRVSLAVGSAWAFLVAAAVVLTWILSGPLFGFSDTWQLVINTGTTIVTFLVVFLIQNTQNRDARAIHLKLDELIRAVHGARNQLVDLEQLSDEELERLQREFHEFHQKYAAHAQALTEEYGRRRTDRGHSRAHKRGDGEKPDKP
jgi:low affinity Fe/Cu permease